MEPKSGNNATVTIVIAFAVLLIVAMICGMGIWMMQRTMTFNEKLLAARLEEAKATAAAQPSAQPPAPAPAVNDDTRRILAALKAARAETDRMKRELADLRARQEQPRTAAPTAPAAKPTEKPAAKPTAKPTAKPAAKPTIKPSLLPAKRKAPTEQPNAAVGPDGRPRDRVILLVGDDEVDWQL